MTWLSRPSRALPLAAVLLVGVVLAAILPTLRARGLGAGEAIVSVHGRARVTRAGGAVESVVARTRLHPGDGLKVEAGSADLELAHGVHYQALAARGDDRATQLQMAVIPTLQAGRLLVTASDGARVVSGGTAVALAGAGAMHVRRSLATEVGVYAGQAQVDSAGVGATVPALRSIEVAALGQVPRQPRPLRYSPSDGWDRQFLSEAIGIDRELRSILAGFRASGGDPDRAAQGMRGALPDPPSAATLRGYLAARQDDDGKLVGTAIAGLGQGGTFASRWQQVFSFRDDGALWGLVALDRGVSSDRLTGAIGRGLDVTQFAFANTGPLQLAGGPLGAGGLGAVAAAGG
ncbi:MAG: hypothetical protein JWN46_3350, partial [Acidimicrobiales bacterium]|nr:hypothetical protein [Acidimicrobiales bacterium]